MLLIAGDHGYHLGEQNMWTKNANFELSTRVPLLVRAPWLGVRLRGARIRHVVELIDIYATLADLALNEEVDEQRDDKNIKNRSRYTIQSNSLTTVYAMLPTSRFYSSRTPGAAVSTRHSPRPSLAARSRLFSSMRLLSPTRPRSPRPPRTTRPTRPLQPRPLSARMATVE